MRSLLFAIAAFAVACAVITAVIAKSSRKAAALFGLVSFTLIGTAAYIIWPLMFPDPSGDGSAQMADRQPAGPQMLTGDGLPPVPRVTQADFDPFRPAEVTGDGYVAAESCQECHQDNYHSWHQSYHRTMTQVATPEAVIGDFDDKTVTYDGQTYRLFRKGEHFWAHLSGEDVPSESTFPILMTTGAHHMQIYWFPTFRTRVVGLMPIVYLRDDQQWVPRKSCFLEPPTDKLVAEIGRWNNTCLQCHSVNPKQRMLGQWNWDTTVSEFGISCEACHGPGKEHIQYHRTIEQNESKSTGQQDPIVNPANLDHRLSSQVCGNCHSVNTHLVDETRENGHVFRPGKPLTESRHLCRLDQESAEQLIARGDDPETIFQRAFWSDGMVRVSGREYSGLMESACYQHGTLSCLSCHRLHQDDGDTRDIKEWANDQLDVGMNTDQACVQCHQAADYGESHTHHAAASEGSRCYNCHMPHTTYGLMKAMRSHKITSPGAQDVNSQRPNACNLCHLDETEAWAMDRLADWYDAPKPELSAEQKTYAAGVLWSLKGDAGIRALVAWHLGWPAAHAASGDDWIAPYLSHLLDDPYDVVRYIAGRSLRSIDGYQGIAFNYVGPREQRIQARQDALSKWNAKTSRREEQSDVLIRADGNLDQSAFAELAAERDDRPMFLDE